jgi:hypothetical protein|tara:strand:+ start:22353 stop:22760 length:408 start_codon:yes stop_codon:yes gene_type:complete
MVSPPIALNLGIRFTRTGNWSWQSFPQLIFVDSDYIACTFAFKSQPRGHIYSPPLLPSGSQQRWAAHDITDLIIIGQALSYDSVYNRIHYLVITSQPGKGPHREKNLRLIIGVAPPQLLPLPAINISNVVVSQTK